MKRVVCIQVLCLIVLCGFSASSAIAVGIGFYTGYSGGSAEWDLEDSDIITESYNADGKHINVGFVLDTTVAKDRVFNYRLKLGYDDRIDKFDDGDKVKLKGFVWSNAFGFGVVRTRIFRLWLGPQLDLLYYNGHPENDNDFDINLFGAGFGPVIGANFNIGSVVTLSLDGGYQFRYYVGYGESINNYDYYDDYDVDYEILENAGFVHFAVIFRFGDRY
ncbi:MAG: hypothetical protein KAJ10_04370 [Thermodesulfovibrionia bacterium]|nr:hypothetical protein [Thermodesulfovibrionia bacterium]